MVSTTTGKVHQQARTAAPDAAGGTAARTKAAPSADGAAGAAGLPVRQGEDPWSEAELAEVREGLEAQVERLRRDIAEAQTELAERLSDSVEGAGDDPTDTGAKAYQREHDLALAYNTRDLLAQSERAIQRMDAGTYGVCERCGSAIGKARLQAFPRATLCVQCKQREERR
ncbi:TraR/DksA family transcriptional regulator [Streptomonospora sp. NEAU-YY374]|uniref:DnaK suppressor protein n=1 Tax=Streptomonospora nanhaiensis TaxID=1323731 RepID=A0A853BHH5_9ACTN|nr:TraR/DksA family transcriptional regulator [Streptomonospora nanhaiensis]MBX9389329.1 TraR/DksA family transcriptional regulator [Streptomonospora nanhaiensis]NYI94829.1 DnaK suppressor protein [Streptomonospora nanhaiensis]